MMILIGGVDRTEYVIRNSCVLTRSSQERADNLSFEYAGPQPGDYEEIYAYTDFTIRSATSNTVTLQIPEDSVWMENNIFRVGERIYVAIGEADEEWKVIDSLSYAGGWLVVTVTENWINTPSAGEGAGVLEFAGSTVVDTSRNIGKLINQQQTVHAVGWAKLFDKKTINKRYADSDARYIINDFCNTTVNHNRTLDDMNYLNSSAAQAAWIEGGDGGNPTLESSDYREGTGCVIMPWTHSAGTATFSDTLSVDIREWAGVLSGAPTKGVLGMWMKAADPSDVTSVEIRIGSSSGNYISWEITPTAEWVFYDMKFTDADVTGTPDWTALDYLVLNVTEVASGSLFVDGIRVLEEKFFRHYPYVQETKEFTRFHIGRVHPAQVMQRIADELGWYWKIDDDKYIHLFPSSTETAPIEIRPNSDNFDNLVLTYDASNLINRQEVNGAEQESDGYYTQIFEGDGFTREWILKNKMKELSVFVDDGTVTDTAESGTTTTTIKATAHGLSVGDWIVNRTRSNATRKVLTVADENTFTVEEVTGQTDGDTFSTGSPVAVGVEGINDDEGYDYMSNFQEKSIRSAQDSDTLPVGTFIWASYKEVFNIYVQRRNATSINRMKTVLGHTDGIFDGEPITDFTIESRAEANSIALAKIRKYNDVVITVTFETNQHGLRVGQQIAVEDTTGRRNVNQFFVIQNISRTEIEHGHYKYSVTCSSLLFGMLELLQQLLRRTQKLVIDESLQINRTSDYNEPIHVTEECDIIVHVNRWKWGPDPDQFRWNLFAWA